MIEIKRCRSGFYAIFIDGVLFYAAAMSHKAAIDYLKTMKIDLIGRTITCRN